MTHPIKTFLLLWLFASTCSFAQTGARSFAHWTPRNPKDDVKDPEDSNFLQFLVRNATTRAYRITSRDGDGLDAIIMRQFLVAPGNAPIAFGIYKTEILRRNSANGTRPQIRDCPGFPNSETAERMNQNRLQNWDCLDLPSGPQFSGLTIPGIDRTQYASELSKAFLKLGATPEDFKEDLVKTARAFTTYSTASANNSDAMESAYQEILGKRLVPARVDVSKFPEEKLSHFDIVSLVSSLKDAPVSGTHKVWSKFLPASSLEEIPCNNPCLRATDLLADAPPMKGPFKNRLVLADSGLSVAASLLAPDAKLVAISGNDYSDVDPNKHGTFNFNEITSPFGPIPPQALVIAKLERKIRPDERDEFDDSVEWIWDLEVLDRAIQAAQNRKRAGIWIFNISAAGAQQYKINPYAEAAPFLFVAAAGNEGRRRSDLHSVPYAFATDRSAFNNVLIVGAIDQNGLPLTPADYSNHDETQVDIFARGSCMCGGSPQNSGTSQAAPLVSAAAFILANERDFGAGDIKWSLISTSDLKQDFDPNPRVALPRGYAVGGVLNLARARKTNPIVITSKNIELEVAAFQFPAVTPGEIPWNSLFQKPGNHSVLRLHRARCSVGNDDWVCFERFVQNEQVESADMHPLPKGTLLRVLTAGGGPPSPDLTAADIFDIIFPVDYKASNKTVTITK